MALQEALARLCATAVRVFYRLEIAGPPVPRRGPVLLVANHPNALLDPALVIAAAGRPVRFLAKSTLFTDRRVGWLVRRAGAIPVYRRSDDPGQVARNVDSFAAVFTALAGGAAAGIFPEGVSHSEPSLARLKTGAARIALGAFEGGPAFPIVPVGIVLERKEAFRSRALVLRGESVEWGELAPRGGDDREAVRELTGRIGEGLRQVTVNLERWEDRPLVESVEALWSAERGAAGSPGEQLARIEAIVRLLGELRRRADGGETAARAGLPPGEAAELARDVTAHRRRLRVLGLEPADLTAELGVGVSLGWTVRRIWALGPLSALLAGAGWLLFWSPYHFTGWLVRRLRLPEELRSTYKLLAGILIYGFWVAALALAAGLAAGPWAAVGALLGVPAVGLWGLYLRERRREIRRHWWRLLLLRSRGELVASLRAEQRRIAERLDRLWEEWQGGPAAGAADPAR